MPALSSRVSISSHLEDNYSYVPEKALAPHSSTLAWRIPWPEEPGGLQSMGSLGVRHDWSDLAAAAYIDRERERLHTVKNLPAMWETWVQSLGWEDPLEQGMATHSRILAWRIPWIEEAGGLQSTVSQRVERNWATNTHTCTQYSWVTLVDFSTPWPLLVGS